MALDREAVRLVADLLQEVQPRMIRGQIKHGVAIRKHDVLLARLALRSFRDADEPRAMQPLLREHLGRHPDLSLAAVDHEEVRHRKLAGDNPRTPARKRLAHRRVIVAAGQAA